MDKQVNPLTKIRLIWMAQLNAVVMFVVVAFYIVRDPVPLDGALHPWALPLALLAMMCGVAIPFVRAQVMGAHALPVLRRSGLIRSQARLDEAALDQAQQEAMRKYSTGTVIGCALAEAACLMGFALAYTAQQPFFIVPFACWAVLLLALQFPFEGGARWLMSPGAQATLHYRG